MKSKKSDPLFEDLLRSLIARVPSILLESYERETSIDSSSVALVDAVARVRVGGESWTLVVEEKSLGQPREVRSAVLQLERLLRLFDRSCYGVILAPFISEESARICAEADIGYADLSGNARLSFGQVYIELQSADRPFREKRQTRSLFTPKSERVLRVLLTPPLRGWKVEELANAAGVSFGQISNVRKQLLDQEWAALSDQGLQLIKPKELVQAWQKVYGIRRQKQDKFYTLLHGEAFDNAMRVALAEAGKGAHGVLASYSAARWIAPYARQSTQFFYADEVGAEVLKKHLQLQSVARGENVVIMQPQEDDVFVGRIEVAPGLWSTGLVQTWLDLSASGERGGEAAEYLLLEKLLPAWKMEKV